MKSILLATALSLSVFSGAALAGGSDAAKTHADKSAPGLDVPALDLGGKAAGAVDKVQGTISADSGAKIDAGTKLGLGVDIKGPGKAGASAGIDTTTTASTPGQASGGAAGNGGLTPSDNDVIQGMGPGAGGFMTPGNEDEMRGNFDRLSQADRDTMLDRCRDVRENRQNHSQQIIDFCERILTF